MIAAYVTLACWFVAMAVTFGLIEWSVRRDRERVFRTRAKHRQDSRDARHSP